MFRVGNFKYTQELWPRKLLAPALLLLIFVILGPMLYAIWLSFTDLSFADASRSGNFIGFANYTRLSIDDAAFHTSLLRSFVFALLCVVIEVSIAIAAAEVLRYDTAMAAYVIPILCLPVLLPPVVIGLYWRLLLQGEFGLASYYLSSWGFPGAKQILSNPPTIILTLVALDVWQWAPFLSLIVFAARAALSNGPIEAAYLDGASPVRAFFQVTLPRLLPVALIIGVLRGIDAFREFDKIFVLTGGGPGSASELSSLYVWRVAFKAWDFGYAGALCVATSVLIYYVSWPWLKIERLNANRF